MLLLLTQSYTEAAVLLQSHGVSDTKLGPVIAYVSGGEKSCQMVIVVACILDEVQTSCSAHVMSDNMYDVPSVTL